MSDLTQKRCLPCEGGIPPLKPEKITELLKQLKGWQLATDSKFIKREFRFKNFHETMAFINAIAWIAHKEDHHADIEFGYNYCKVRYNTHAVEGLTENDFICAAKVDALLEVNPA